MNSPVRRVYLSALSENIVVDLDDTHNFCINQSSMRGLLSGAIVRVTVVLGPTALPGCSSLGAIFVG